MSLSQDRYLKDLLTRCLYSDNQTSKGKKCESLTYGQIDLLVKEMIVHYRLSVQVIVEEEMEKYNSWGGSSCTFVKSSISGLYSEIDGKKKGCCASTTLPRVHTRMYSQEDRVGERCECKK